MNQSKQKQNNRNKTYKDYRFWNYSEHIKPVHLKKTENIKNEIIKSMRYI